MISKELIDGLANLNFWGKKQDSGIERHALKESSNLIERGTVFSLIGIRRCGKTYLTRQILSKKIKGGAKKEQTLYINFEDPALEPYLSTALLDDIYKSYRHCINKDGRVYIVLDEIQNVPKWEKWVRIMLERKEDVEFIVSGSSSSLLSSEISTTLTGRTITYILYPLSFAEFIKFKNISGNLEEKKLMSLLGEYVEFGGFPVIALSKNKDFKTRYLKEIFEGILTRDIIKRYAIRQEHELRSLAVILLNNFSSLISVNRLKNLMHTITKRKISPTTVNNYLKYFSDPFLFFYVPIFSYKIKDQIQYPRKIYCIDTGIINHVSYKSSPNKGKLYENLVAVELIKREGKENIFYWKSRQQEEVDFIVKYGENVRKIVQVCYELNDRKIKKREIKSLLKASNELRCSQLYVITHDYEAREEHNNKKIRFIPLHKWLLGGF